MQKPSLQSVAPELQSAILSHIPRPSDLKSLCLTCQQLGAVATEKLYKEVLLDVGVHTRKPGFFVHNHRGHRHIRSLTVFVAANEQVSSPSTYGLSANAAIRLALQLLPRHTLKSFSTELWVEPDTATTLITQQMAMEDLAPGIISHDALELPLSLPEFLPNLTRLSIECHHGSRCDGNAPMKKMYGELVRSCRHLKHLSLFRFYERTDGDGKIITSEDLDEQARAMFERLLMPVGARGAALSLDELHLQNLHVGPQDCGLTTMVDFENLKWLSIRDGIWPSLLAENLSIAFGKCVPKLRGLIWSDDMDNRYDALDHLQQLLRNFSGLEYISIASERDERDAAFDMDCLNTHLVSLRHLRLPGGDSEFVLHKISECKSWILSLSEVQALAAEVHKLRQIALGFPELRMRDSNRGDMQGYNKFLDAIARLPELEILHVLTWPIAQSRSASNMKMAELKYLRKLDSLASHFARRFAAVQPHIGS